MDPNGQNNEFNVLSEETLEAEKITEDLENTTPDTPVMQEAPEETIAVRTIDDFHEGVKKEEEVQDVKKKKSKNRGRITRLNISIAICLLIIAIPFAVLGYILISAQQVNNTPIVGERFTGQHEPEITEDHMNQVMSAIRALDGVQNVTADTTVATTRISIDCNDDISEDQMKALADQAYDALNEILPIDTYYTNTDTMELYDLEIMLYNNLDYEYQGDPGLLIVDVVKNGMAEGKIVQVLTTPKNASAAEAALQSVKDRIAAEEAEKEAEANGENTEETENTEGTEGTEESTENNEG